MTPNRESSGKPTRHPAGGPKKSGERHRLIPQDVWPCIGAAAAGMVRNPIYLSQRFVVQNGGLFTVPATGWLSLPQPLQNGMANT
jgi:hypothetical protein